MFLLCLSKLNLNIYYQSYLLPFKSSIKWNEAINDLIILNKYILHNKRKTEPLLISQ